MINYKLIINKYIKIFINGIIAGVLISIGAMGLLYSLGSDNQILGGFLFGFGFLLVCLYGYESYTNKIGYLGENNWLFILECFLVLIGNYLGTWLLPLVLKMTSFSLETNSLMIGLNKVIEYKMQDGLVFDYFGRSLIAGIIIYLAYNTYKKAEQPIARFSSIFLGAIFISTLGLNELVSDLFIINLAALSNYDYGHLFVGVIYVLVGNTLGSIIIPLFRKMKGYLKSI